MKLGVCGLRCEECSAYTAGECGGCSENHAAQCEMRKCAKEQNCTTCRECTEFDSCKPLNDFFGRSPHAKQNLLQA